MNHSEATVAPAYLLISRYFLKVILAKSNNVRWLAHRIAVVGSGELACRFVAFMNSAASDLVQIVGVFDERIEPAEGRIGLHGLLRGNTDALIAYARDNPIDKVIIAIPHGAEERLLNILRKLRSIPADIAVAPDLAGFKMPELKGHTLVMEGLPLLNLAPSPIQGTRRLTKHLIDVGRAFLLLITLSPLFVLISTLIKLDSSGPVFFIQKRFGLGNRVISVFKFRTMTTDQSDYGGSRQAVPGIYELPGSAHFSAARVLMNCPRLSTCCWGTCR
jgi:hypothetical protein